MWGWLGGLINFFSGGLNAIWNAFVNVMRTFDGWVEARINWLSSRCDSLLVGEWNISLYISNFIHQSYVPTVERIDAIIRATQQREHTDYIQLRDAINTDRSWMSGQLARLAAYALSLFSDLIKWVIGTIFGPLSREVASALAWISREGAYVFDLLTHPEKLVKLLIAFLWVAWIALLQQYAKPIVTYIVAHMRDIAPLFLSVLEDILTAVLLRRYCGHTAWDDARI